MKKTFFLVVLFFGILANGQVINFTDINFKNKLVQAAASNNTAKNLAGQYFKIDSNSNGQIEVSEALQVKELYINQSGISNITGIGNFVNLYKLECYGNTIANLDLENLPNLFHVLCISNNMSTIDLSGLTNLSFLNCGNNNLSSIDFSETPNLSTFHSGQNDFTEFDLNGLTQLYRFDCTSNNVTVLHNLNDCVFLEDLFIDSNLFTSIDLSVLPRLARFYGSYNLFSMIDLTNNPLMNTIHIPGNPNLSSLFCKNGVNELYFTIDNCPNLHYICSDDNQSETNLLSTKIAQYGYNCELNSYCSFVPGGEYFVVNGQQRFDDENDGCDNNDVIISNLRINQTVSGNIVGSYINNDSGLYSIPVQAGTYSFIPVLENPSYFTISPSSFNVTFPTDVSPFTQDFCITPNGSHTDIEIEIIPISAARPGFDASYKLLYKNKGNSIQSGYIELHFDDDKSDFVSAIPNVTTQVTNLLTWDYTNLQPFEKREIVFTVNVNSPTEIPAINSGDALGYGAIVFPMITDEQPNDNHSDLKQIVVNSLDPNDKTCTRGTITDTEAIGNYVNYVIRFENSGTYPAENIVVKDMIDLTKFNISTLIPISSSHDFVTKIKDNKVEFIFENINLPFDNATNDGYIAFKIKTLPTLVVGDTFTNNASIYFDYNFPIITNVASTTIQALANPDFEFETYFSLSPIPTKNVLNIQTKNEIQLSSISIYNTLGQLVLVVTAPSSSIDVSNLKTGNYFIKILSDKGTTISKFIKE